MNINTTRVDYPDYINKPAIEFNGKSIFYFLEIQCIQPAYKFGITHNSINRLRKHYRKLGIKSVIKIIDCVYDSVMRTVETEFKRYTKTFGVRVNMFGQTEILLTKSINIYVGHVEAMVADELTRPQPANIRNKIIRERVVITELNIDNGCDKCGMKFRDTHDFNCHKNVCGVENLQIIDDGRTLFDREMRLLMVAHKQDRKILQDMRVELDEMKKLLVK